MGEYKYCHKNAGWFSSKHLECEQKFNRGISEIRAIVGNSFNLKEDFFMRKEQIDQIIRREYVGRSRVFNIRITKGIYCRTGGSKGTPIEKNICREYLRRAFV